MNPSGLDVLITTLEQAPMWVSALILLFASAIEYVFPPFPGDTILVAGGFFASHGVIRMELAVFALSCGTLLGSTAAWCLGFWAMQGAASREKVQRLVKPEYLEKVRQAYARYGNWILFFNRFLPGIRGAFMIAAGMIGLPLKRVLFWCLLSALVWNTMLVSIGFWFAANLETMLSIFQMYTYAVLGIVSMIAVVVALYMITRKKL